MGLENRKMSLPWFNRCMLDARYDPMFRRMRTADEVEALYFLLRRAWAGETRRLAVLVFINMRNRAAPVRAFRRAMRKMLRRRH